MPALQAVPSGNPQIMPHRCHLAEHEYRRWRNFPEAGHTREQVTAPEYWAHQSSKHRVGDIIEVYCEDGSYYGELLVTACEKNYSKVHVLSWHELDGKAVMSDAKFRVEFKGPVKKHCVIRVSDSAIVHEGISSKDDAVRWLEENRAHLT